MRILQEGVTASAREVAAMMHYYGAEIDEIPEGFGEFLDETSALVRTYVLSHQTRINENLIERINKGRDDTTGQSWKNLLARLEFIDSAGIDELANYILAVQGSTMFTDSFMVTVQEYIEDKDGHKDGLSIENIETETNDFTFSFDAAKGWIQYFKHKAQVYLDAQTRKLAKIREICPIFDIDALVSRADIALTIDELLGNDISDEIKIVSGDNLGLLIGLRISYMDVVVFHKQFLKSISALEAILDVKDMFSTEDM